MWSLASIVKSIMFPSCWQADREVCIPANRVEMKTVSGAPLGLRVARILSRSHVRGAGALTRLLGRLGRLDKIAQYELGTAKFGVPLGRIPWDFSDLTNYEAKLVASFCRAAASLQNATLFDCGADIGTFSALVCSRTN